MSFSFEIFCLNLRPMHNRFPQAALGIHLGNCWKCCWGKQCFYINHLSKNIAEVIILLQNIYSVYNFYNYFSTKVAFTNKRYHLHMLEKYLYVLQEVRYIMYFGQFIPSLSLCSRGNGTSFAFNVLYFGIGKIL